MVVTRREPDDALAVAEPEARAESAPAEVYEASVWDRIEPWLGPAIAGVCCLFVLFELFPHLLLRDTTPTGGDTGAHVWWPAYLRDHLLPQGRIAGWAPDFYAGFPAGQFYFPLPALLVVALDVVLPYNIAFKLVTALGPVALPAGAYVFGRGLRVPRPAPAFFAVGATVFLFFKDFGGTIAGNQHIMGGNLASNAAGEFSFTIALALAFFFLGTFARALDRRRTYWLPAALLAATVMSHLVVAVFALIGAVVIWAARRPLRTVGIAAAIVGVGGLLTAVWTLPLLATRAYQTDMRYEPIDAFGRYMIPPRYLDLVLVPLVIAAIVGGIVKRRRATFVVLAIAVVTGLAFRFWEPLSRAVLGGTPVWNLRLLPFWYCGLVFVAALGAAEIVRGVAWLVTRPIGEGERWWKPLVARSTPALDSDAVATGDDERIEPRAGATSHSFAQGMSIAVLAALVTGTVLVQAHRTRSFLPFWAKWNETGYEAVRGPEQKAYPEYKALTDTMRKLPGGRALWEPGAGIGKYGTPLALMLLPYWTDGRIASMEGLYYESSATTPYHFLAVATLTAPGSASNPQRGLPYRTIDDFDVGVKYLQTLGVRYYMAESDRAKQEASRSPDLALRAEAPDLDKDAPRGWQVYEVRDAPLVAPLRYEPVVVPHVDPHKWQDDVAVPWWDRPTRTDRTQRDLGTLDRPLVDDGPSRWRRARPPGVSRRDAPDSSLPTVDEAPRRSLPNVEVTKIRSDDHSVSFDVSRAGVPVVVRASYFPNWTVTGGNGPWRATPNFMVVVPTSKHVRLEYASTNAERLGRAGTTVGLVGLVGLVVVPAYVRRKRKNVSAAEN